MEKAIAQACLELTDMQSCGGSNMKIAKIGIGRTKSVYGIKVKRSDYNKYLKSDFREKPHPLFDPQWYASMYLGNSHQIDPFKHYSMHSKTAEFDPNPLFDSKFYSRNNPDSLVYKHGILAHYIDIGSLNGAKANILFDPKYYKDRYKDVNFEYFDSLKHYIEYGSAERRSTHAVFDAAWYCERYRDVAKTGMDPLVHYLQHGIYEWRNPHPLIDLRYLASQLTITDLNPRNVLEMYLYNPEYFSLDPHFAFVTEYFLASTRGVDRSQHALIHYLSISSSYGIPNEVFDSNWYLNTYPDIMKHNINPLVHYVTKGYVENRNPSDAFDTAWYLQTNDDVNNSQLDPVSHYVKYGKIEGRQPRPPNSEFYSSGDQVKLLTDVMSKLRLERFLQSDLSINFPKNDDPSVSIVLVLFNKAHLTLDCLRSIEQNIDQDMCAYEVIIYDNCSGDATHDVLRRVHNAKIIKGTENIGFLRAVNAASSFATGEYILLLNNDTYVLPQSVEIAHALIESCADVGAVGGKLILPSGVVQEAGSIIWSDGSCLGYMRNCQIDYFEANFQREVDYCSGAFLMLRKSIFLSVGGLDEAYYPAYYEETDLCVKIKKEGFKIVYEPSIEILHYEFGSTENLPSVLKLQEEHRQIFSEQHQDVLASKYPPNTENILRARFGNPNRLNILFIDDKVPHPSLGSGFPRAQTILNELAKLNVNITLLPTDDDVQSWRSVRHTLDARIEVAFGYKGSQFAEFLKSRHGTFDGIVVSRPHNMQRLNELISQGKLELNMPIFYDAEALFSLREIGRRTLLGSEMRNEEKQALIEEEIAIARNATGVICVTDQEGKLFRDSGKQVFKIGHVLDARPGAASFSARADFLFVGGFDNEETPNTDSIIWFLDDIFPIILEKIADCRLILVGNNKSASITSRLNSSVVSLGRVDKIEEIYNRSRVFIAPTRFAAGIPHKVHEAVAAGVPTVVTSLLAHQLCWDGNNQTVVGNNAEDFASACIELYTNERLWHNVRSNGLAAINVDCSYSHVRQALKTIVSECSSIAIQDGN
ncbi:glycosyltransferase [Methylobacterium crusticola]|nr:glycosyltransferase [Methylobacterium crusticola]